MNDDLLGYNEMVETAMRSVVRQALDRAAKGGLPGNHHFYITFRTDHPDVVIPNRLREQYADEMTIVLQHQFWGLQPDDEGFDVELSFNRRHEHLRIPYAALITFADPSVNFGLQFHVEASEEDLIAAESRPEAASDEKGPGHPNNITQDDGEDESQSDDDEAASGDTAEGDPVASGSAKKSKGKKTGNKPAEGESDGDGDGDDPPDNVVTLDFKRKK